MRFETSFVFTDRQSKAEYIWSKYRELLNGSILDVGADERFLASHLPDEAKYLGIGLGGNPDMEFDLDSGPLPFEDNHFDCVLCFDVLEHLENIHFCFDELCRVSSHWVVISLPNPWMTFYKRLRYGWVGRETPLKFYGLPVEIPEDRHRWFFSGNEAEAFLQARAKRAGMKIIQMDRFPSIDDGSGPRSILRRWIRRLFLHPSVDEKELLAGPLWAVLEVDHAL